MLANIWTIFQALVGYNLVLPLLLYCGYWLFRGRNKATGSINDPEPDYAIIVTAYEQTDLVPAAGASIP